MIGIVAAGLAGFCALLALWRFMLGPSLYDRALAAHAIVALAAFSGAALASASGDGWGVDVSFSLLLGLFVFDVALLKFTRLRSFQPPLAARRDVRR